MSNRIDKSITNCVNDGKSFTIINVDQYTGEWRKQTEDIKEV